MPDDGTSSYENTYSHVILQVIASQ